MWRPHRKKRKSYWSGIYDWKNLRTAWIRRSGNGGERKKSSIHLNVIPNISNQWKRQRQGRKSQANIQNQQIYNFSFSFIQFPLFRLRFGNPFLFINWFFCSSFIQQSVRWSNFKFKWNEFSITVSSYIFVVDKTLHNKMLRLRMDKDMGSIIRVCVKIESNEHFI